MIESERNRYIQALEENMAAKFSFLPSLSPTMNVSTDGGMLVINSHLHSDIFNIIWQTTTDDLAKLLIPIDMFNAENLPFAWWTGFSKEPPALSKKLITLGLTCTEHEIGMGRSLITNLPDTKVIADLNIVAVKSPKVMRDFISVLTKQIPNEIEPIITFYQSTQHHVFKSDNPLKLFVGYFNHKPVAMGASFERENVIGIWDIVTLPEVRGKGIASHMVLHILNQGKLLGYAIAVLSASDEGKRVYRKLGFKPLQDLFVYNLLDNNQKAF